MVATVRLLAAGLGLALWGLATPPASLQAQEDDSELMSLEESRQKFMNVDLRTLTDHPGLGEALDISERDYQRIDLGRQLLFDPLLSSDGTTSCASCPPAQIP